MSINQVKQRNQEKQANMVVNTSLEVGTYKIVCKNCGEAIYGPVLGDYTEAARKSMKLSSKECPNRCKNSSWDIHINPIERKNKYSKDNPYPPKDLI